MDQMWKDTAFPSAHIVVNAISSLSVHQHHILLGSLSAVELDAAAP